VPYPNYAGKKWLQGIAHRKKKKEKKKMEGKNNNSIAVLLKRGAQRKKGKGKASGRGKGDPKRGLERPVLVYGSNPKRIAKKGGGGLGAIDQGETKNGPGKEG